MASARKRLPLRFEANAGQWDARAKYVARGRGTTLVLTDDAMWSGLRDPSTSAVATVTMKLVGARPSAPVGEGELVTKSHFFLGNDPSRWRTNVPNFGQVRAKQWLPGVDVVWHEGLDGPEFDLDVAADVDAAAITLELEGARTLRVREDDALLIGTAAGVLVWEPPRVIQKGRELHASYRLVGDGRVRFDLDGYERGVPILIDPSLVYSTYLGSAWDDYTSYDAIAVDANGSAYVAGATNGFNFPTLNAFQPAQSGSSNEAFVAKLNPSGSALVYATYLGGSKEDRGYGIALDGSGSAYVTGYTESLNFPMASALQNTPGGGLGDVFVTKLTPAGSALVYSTYLGGGGLDSGSAIAVDGGGRAYVTGNTSGNFPTVNAAQASFGGGFADAFVTRLDAAGSSLNYSTYLGGLGDDYGYGLTVDGGSSAYVAGSTSSSNFPTVSAYQASYGGSDDAFVTKVSPSGSSLWYSTYLGGPNGDYAYGVAVDGSGSAYVVGSTQSGGFSTPSAYQLASNGANEAFLTKLSSSGSSRVYATYLGGTGFDYGYGVAVDANGRAYVVGTTSSTNFPVLNPYQSLKSGTSDAFVTEVDSLGASLVYSTYLGGGGTDYGYAIALDANANAYITGVTPSTFPTTSGAFRTSSAGSNDAFIAKLGYFPLVLVPASANVPPKGARAFVATGGAGGYAYSLATNASGGSIDPSTGAYTAGSNANVTDVVRVTDALSVTKTANVAVGPGVSISPSSAATGPNGTINFVALGGSGVGFAWSLSTNASGGSINPSTGQYTAGAVPNSIDVVAVSDSLGNAASGAINVGSSVSITPSAATSPPKGKVAFSATGGSGTGQTWSFLVNGSGGSINAGTGAYAAGSTGSVTDTIRVVDSFGNVASATITVSAAVAISPPASVTPPMGPIAFSATNGSGAGYVWSLSTNASGGTIAPTTGAYLAGPKGNVTDIVKVSDSVGASATASIAVGPAIVIAPATPSAPPSGTVVFAATGGSGSGYVWSIASNKSGSTIDPTTGAYKAGTAGSKVDTVRVVDALGNQATVNVSVGGGLAINPAAPSVWPKGTLAFTATGGSGTGYVWSLFANSSGSTIDAKTSAYTADPLGDVTDVVEVVDSLGNATTVDVKVTAALSIAPASQTVAPGETFAFSGSGGSGKGYVWSLDPSDSGGSLDAAGAYTAGTTVGVTDTVRLTDSWGNVATGTVAVANAIADAGTAPATAGDSSGCGCRSAGVPAGTPGVGLLAVAAAMLLVRRRTRRRASDGSRARSLAATIAVALLVTTFADRGAVGSAPSVATSVASDVSAPFGASLPVAFERNDGQFDPRVRYAARTGGGAALYLTDEGATLALVGATGAAAVTMTVTRGPGTAPVASMPLVTKTNYFIGTDPSAWRTNVPNFARVTYPSIRRGVDLVYHGEHGTLEYDLVVSPGANVDDVAIAIGGAGRLEVLPNGDLRIETAAGRLIQKAPHTYQLDLDGEPHDVKASFRLRDGGVGFEVASYDPARTLVIDPALVYSTYLGGSNHDGNDNSVYSQNNLAVDAAGHAHVGGLTCSPDFPTTQGAYQTTASPLTYTCVSFVTKFATNGSSLLYSTYFGPAGGVNSTKITSLALDASGHVFAAGITSSFAFPVVNPLQASLGGNDDGFIVELDATGSSLLFSTYFGGSAIEDTCDIALDAAGNIYVSGQTSSTNLPLVNALYPASGSGRQAFVAEVASSKTSLVYSTYLGTVPTVGGAALAVDADGGAYVAGMTTNCSLPDTNGAAQPACGGGPRDGFVIKIAPGGGSIAYATYLGGNGEEYATSIDVDATGNAYVVGLTTSTNFPTKNPYQAVFGGSVDAFVTKINPSGSAFVYSTYLGGTLADAAYAVTVDGAGHAFVTGDTRSANFPVKGAFQAKNLGNPGAFVSVLDAAGAGFVYSTHLSGAGIGYGAGIAFDGQGATYVTGWTQSTAFPTVAPFQASASGGWDVFVAKIGPDPALVPVITVTPPTASTYLKGKVSFAAKDGTATGFVWIVQTNNSGGSIDAQTGVYTAGPKGGVTDVVRVSDSLTNTGTATVAVTPALAISPAAPTVAPKGILHFSGSGGSGLGYVWSIATNASGGKIAPNGTYVAGAADNATDVIALTDLYGDQVTTEVVVRAVVDAGDDASGAADGSDADAGAGGTSASGCSCTTGGERRAPAGLAVALGALGLLAARRRRRA